MPRNLFTREMERLKTGLVEMGHTIDLSLEDTMRVLRTADGESAQRVAQREAEADRLERRMEDMCVTILALQQPLASDLRTITAALKIVTDMERISDQCYDICELANTFVPNAEKTPARILDMLTQARAMFHEALESFVTVDAQKARAVCQSDDAVDRLFSQAVLAGCSTISGRLTGVPQAVDYMFIAKYIERIADHATNIAEWVLFMQTGTHPDDSK